MNPRDVKIFVIASSIWIIGLTGCVGALSYKQMQMDKEFTAYRESHPNLPYGSLPAGNYAAPKPLPGSGSPPPPSGAPQNPGNPPPPSK